MYFIVISRNFSVSGGLVLWCGTRYPTRALEMVHIVVGKLGDTKDQETSMYLQKVQVFTPMKILRGYLAAWSISSPNTKSPASLRCPQRSIIESRQRFQERPENSDGQLIVKHVHSIPREGLKHCSSALAGLHQWMATREMMAFTGILR